MSNPETPTAGDSVRNPFGRIQAWLSRTASILSGTAIPESNYDPGRHGTLTRFSGLDGYEEIDRYLGRAAEGGDTDQAGRGESSDAES